MRASLLICGFLLGIAVQAQGSPEQIIQTFFTTYEKGDPEVALTELYANMPWADRITDDLNKLKTQLAGLETLVGTYYGYSLIGHKELADTYSIYSYIVKFDRQPVRFVFQFYKPQEEWGLFAFSFDDSLDAEMEEAMKVYHLKLNE